MSQHRSETPFDSIESSLEFVSLLGDAIRDALAEIAADISLAEADLPESEGSSRKIEALQLVRFKLKGLDGHIESSHRILNDLRTLRRLLLEERTLGNVVHPTAR